MSTPYLETVDGLPLTERRIRAGLRVNIIAGMLGMMWAGMAQGVPLTMLFDALGAAGVIIGLVVTTQQLTMVSQIPAAIFAERLPSRKLFWATLAIVHRMLWFGPALLPLLLPSHPQAIAWGVLGIVTLSALLANCSSASWFSWMADLVPESLAGRFWGSRQSMVMSSYLVSLAISGILLDALPTTDGHYGGFAVVFSLAAILGVADILVHLRVPEPRPRRHHTRTAIAKRLLAPFKDRDFFWLTVAMGVWYFSVGLVGSFGIVYLKRDFGATYTEISLITISASIGGIVAGIPLGTLIDRIGARTFGAILLVAAPACGIFWFFVTGDRIHFDLPLLGPHDIPQPIVMFTITNILAGALYSGVGLSQLNLAGSLAPKEGRTVAMAMHWSTVGLMAALGPVVGGWIMDLVTAHPLGWVTFTGHPWSFFQLLVIGHIASSWLIAAPLLLLVRGKGATMPVGLALARLGNPLRAITNLYHVYQVNSPASSDKRAGAARRLGDRKGAIAVVDLIEKLDDPSADVREEAVLALGKIGSPEAIQALIERLEHPDGDLAALIARALRESRPTASVDALLQKLGDDDRETLTESARTLGAIGDPRAAPSLLELMRTTGDTKVLGASSEALARLGELAAIYEIIPHLRVTHNPVLKRSLAVAVADLLGTPGEFYTILAKELQTSGSEVERLLKELARRLRRHVPKAMAPQTEHLVSLIDTLQAAWDAGDVPKTADALLRLALGLAALIHGAEQGTDAKTLMDDLVARDQRIAVTVWYLDVLRATWAEETWGPRDQVDLLIGIYAVHAIGDRLKASRDPADSPDSPA